MQILSNGESELIKGEDNRLAVGILLDSNSDFGITLDNEKLNNRLGIKGISTKIKQLAEPQLRHKITYVKVLYAKTPMDYNSSSIKRDYRSTMKIAKI